MTFYPHLEKFVHAEVAVAIFAHRGVQSIAPGKKVASGLINSLFQVDALAISVSSGVG
jgi:hypothetical protein